MNKIENYDINSRRWFSLEDFEGEKWKDVPGYIGLYKVSNFGRVKRIGCMYLHKGKYLCWIKNKILRLTKGVYYSVTLYRDGEQKHFQLHRLLAIVFIPNPNNFEFINHKDENKYNNRLDNLEWCTRLYNNTYGTARIRGAESRRKSSRFGIVAIEKKKGNIHIFKSKEDVADFLKVRWCNIYVYLNHDKNRNFIKGFYLERLSKVIEKLNQYPSNTKHFFYDKI